VETSVAPYPSKEGFKSPEIQKTAKLGGIDIDGIK
jgi:hypothetical protein